MTAESQQHTVTTVGILTKFSSLAALKVVILTTFSSASDENFMKMTTFSFQCIQTSIQCPTRVSFQVNPDYLDPSRLTGFLSSALYNNLIRVNTMLSKVY